MAEQPISARFIKALIDHECSLYNEYHALLIEERDYITKSNSEKIIELSDKRLGILEKMNSAQDKRKEIVKEITGDEKSKLTEAIAKKFKGDEARYLQKAAAKLRGVIQKSQRMGRECNGIVQFGMNMVNGLFSIFMTATKNVTRSYDSRGTVKESYNPTGNRQSGVIKEA